MKTIDELNDKKVIVRIDESLDKYNDSPIFQKKLDMANEFLLKHGLPKEYWTWLNNKKSCLSTELS